MFGSLLSVVTSVTGAALDVVVAVAEPVVDVVELVADEVVVPVLEETADTIREITR